MAMDELDKYECFGVPAHVWVRDDVMALAPATAPVPRRSEVPGEGTLLGIEAIPSPALAEFHPAK
jgi:hypothetical protein